MLLEGSQEAGYTGAQLSAKKQGIQLFGSADRTARAHIQSSELSKT